MARACARSDITPERVVMRRNLRNTHELSTWDKGNKKKKGDGRREKGQHHLHSDPALTAGMDSGSCSAVAEEEVLSCKLDWGIGVFLNDLSNPFIRHQSMMEKKKTKRRVIVVFILIR